MVHQGPCLSLRAVSHRKRDGKIAHDRSQINFVRTMAHGTLKWTVA